MQVHTTIRWSLLNAMELMILFNSFQGYENFLFPVFIMICVGGGMLALSVFQVRGP